MINYDELKELIANNEKKCAIVGAGSRGKKIVSRLSHEKMRVDAVLDNNAAIWGEEVNGIKIDRIQNLGNDWNYVISIDLRAPRKDVKKQLIELNIHETDIYEYFNDEQYEHYKEVYLNGKCQEELSKLYKERFGRDIDWENPKKYTEILNWEKLNVSDPFRTMLADKVAVRNWVKEKIGEKYLIKRYFEWDTVDEIDFEQLPDRFVLKLNNGSGRNIIVKDKRELDIEETKDILSIWLKQNYAFCNGCYEMQYKDIVPKIVCEEYLEGVAETVYDYNIYCFHGKPEYIWCIKGSHRPECQASFYDKDWNMQPFSFGYPKDPVVAPRPDKLEEMLRLSEILCQGFKHIRVDWYSLPDGRVLFGEMTFTSWSGLQRFEPDEYDDIFGKLITDNN